VFIETKRPLFVGEELILSFSMPGFGKALKVRGEIVQVSRSGIGVEFQNMSPYVEEMIAALINRMKEELD
jgi:Tfp pilus assembly protein PilZ